MTTFVAGGYECELIADGHGVLPPEMAFANAPAGERDAALADRLDESGQLPIPYGCLLIRTPDGPVLIDAGIGAYEHPAGGRGGELVAQLERLGVRPAEIRVVLITHSHLDHIGGLWADGGPRFASARHMIGRTEWDWQAARDDAPASHEQLPPLEREGLIDLIDAPAEVLPGIRMIPAPGHTPATWRLRSGAPTERCTSPTRCSTRSRWSIRNGAWRLTRRGTWRSRPGRRCSPRPPPSGEFSPWPHARGRPYRGLRRAAFDFAPPRRLVQLDLAAGLRIRRVL